MSYTVRPLLSGDAEQLRHFVCSIRPREWELVVQDMIQEYLPGRIADGSVTGLGAWHADILCGVAAWSPTRERPGVWYVHVIAVASGYRNQGLGTHLKRQVIDRARDKNIAALLSTVHIDNVAMEKVNEALGATCEAIPGDRVHRNWILPV